MGAYGSQPAELRPVQKAASADMGKSCIRFKSLDGVALDVIRDSCRSAVREMYRAIKRR